jgi:UDP-N-acetylmuramyl pentapeptide phosphotransferase/UDP-N-acetylglucosamine-1-phosphate transferase
VHALPFVLASLIAAALAPATLRLLAERGQLRPNYRAQRLPFPFGIAIVAAALLALAPLAVLQRLDVPAVLYPETFAVVVYVLGVALLGFVDDMLGDEQARGWRGHGQAALSRRLSTGTLKAGGSLGLALYATSALDLSVGHWLLASVVLVLATNVFNLLDLRPGRAVKAFSLLGAGLALGTLDLRPLWAIGLFAGPALVAGVYDVRERAMLGDTGANLLGALAGLWLVFALSTAGQIVAAVLLAAITVYGELRSITSLVERTPGLRELDSWGRPSHQ